MKNLAGTKNEEADGYIQEELVLAGIPLIRGEISTGEVHYSITGRLDNWSFVRAWYYWMAYAEEGDGMPLAAATQMHERPYPIAGTHQPKIYGEVIRVNGDCGCPPPKGRAMLYDAEGRVLQYDPEGANKRVAAGFLKKGFFTHEEVDSIHFVRTKKSLEELTARAVIASYHVDSQLGLNELARVISGYWTNSD